MGGNSSKQPKKAKKSSLKNSSDDKTVVAESSFSNAVTNNNSHASDHPNCSKKKKAKNNVKIKDGEKNKKKGKKDNRRVRTGSCQNVDTVFFVENSEVEAEGPHSPLYRKKSSCPSCEAKDILMGSNRSRSPSAKSLRYSDFNKVSRKTKMYDWELQPVDIPLHGAPKPDGDETCYVCGVYTGVLVRTCRVCLRTYHDGCLAKIGHGLSEVARTLSNRGRWSCHQCVSLNHLLTQEEVRDVMDSVIDLGLSTESLSESDYKTFCQAVVKSAGVKVSEELTASWSRRFQLMDKTNKGQLTWTQFLNMESIRILDSRCPESLVNLLTQAELHEARTVFIKLDKQQSGYVKKSDLHAMFDSDKSAGDSFYPDERAMYDEDDLTSPVSWVTFLCERAIYILAQRPNNVSAVEHSEEDLLEDEAVTPSFETIDDDDDDDDEEYNTCASELGASASSSAGPLFPRHRTSRCFDSSGDNLETTDSSGDALDKVMTSRADKSSDRLDAARAFGSRAPLSCAESNLSERKSQTDGGGGLQSSTGGQFRRSSATRSGNLQNVPLFSSVKGQGVAEQKPVLQRRSGVTCVTSAPFSQRRSEVIERRTLQLSIPDRETKALSHAGFKYQRGMQIAPAYGNLVGKMQHIEWKC